MKQNTFGPIKKAIFPVAGLGTRFLPATKASPKEMLPVVDKPLIQYAVEEAYAAGIRDMIFVTGRNKRAIEDHFDVAYELEAELLQKQKHELLALVESIKPNDMECFYVRQPQVKGLGDAILCAERLVQQDEAFAVLLADDLMVGEPPVMKQLVDLYNIHRSSVLAVQNVPKDQTHQYGIVKATSVEPGLVNIEGMIEKPTPDQAPSTLAVVGRYVLSSSVFKHLGSQPIGVGGELQLTDGIAALLGSESVYGYEFQGQRFDCGSKLGLLQASVSLGVAHPQIGDAFGSWLKQVHLESSL